MLKLRKMYDVIFQDKECLDILSNFHMSVWAKLSYNEKLELLNRVNKRVAELYGYTEPKLNVDKGSSNYGSFGAFFWDVTINKNSLENDDCYEVIDTYFHELRHSFQHRAVANELTDKEECSKEERLMYKENFKYGNYFPGDSDYYLYQYVERDAWATGMLFANKIHFINAKKYGIDAAYKEYY